MSINAYSYGEYNAPITKNTQKYMLKCTRFHVIWN